MPEFPKVETFKGLNNRIDPVRLGLEWQLQADNCLCDDAGFLLRRPGQVAVSSGFLDLYGTRNGRLLAITTNNALVEINAAGESALLYSGITGGPFQWIELGYALFLMSPKKQWAIYPHQAILWGSLCPTVPDESELPYPLSDPISYPPPFGEILGVRRSQVVVGAWESDRDRSVLYFSRPDYPHEFRLDRDWLIVPGQVTMLASVTQGMVIGTDRAIYVDLIDSPLMQVAEYGVPYHGFVYDERDIVWFWSERGLCTALPFKNLTEATFVGDDRSQVTAALLDWQGSRYAVIHQHGNQGTRPRVKAYMPLSVETQYLQQIS